MFNVPHHLRHGPFRRADALASGLPRGVLQGPQFRRLYEAVYCHVGHEPSFADRIAAARLALPDDARTTGITRLQESGIDHGPRSPLHFVVEGDHHLALPDVFLHRTVKLPPNDETGVTIEAAFVAYCAEAALIDAIKVGCVLLRQEKLDLSLCGELVTGERWRRGALEAAYVVPFLNERCRSMPEAELLAYVVAAGLPAPDVNRTLEIAPGIRLTPDQWYALGLAVEYEGSQHQEDRAQYNSDIDRYALYRRAGIPYELITKERLRHPRSAIRIIHRALADRGYDGGPPDFGAAWEELSQPVSRVIRPRASAWR